MLVRIIDKVTFTTFHNIVLIRAYKLNIKLTAFPVKHYVAYIASSAED